MYNIIRLYYEKENFAIMDFQLLNSKRAYGYVGAISMLFGLLALSLKAPVWVALLAALFLGATLSVKISFRDNVNRLVVIPIFVVTSIAIFLYMQFIISAGLDHMRVMKFILNVMFIYSLQFLLFSMCGSIRASVATILTISCVIGFIDHLVVQTRSMEIAFSDFWSISTGLSVVGSYRFTLSVRTVSTLLLLVPFVILLCRTTFFKFNGIKIRLIAAGSGALLISMVTILVSTAWGCSMIGFVDKYWKYRASEYNGFYLNLIHTASATKVSVPKDYSPGMLEQLLNDRENPRPDPPASGTEQSTEPALPPESATTPADKSGKPNLIVIMDETFTDLQAISRFMVENGYAATELLIDEEVLPYFNSLNPSAPNIERGWALSSVFGGNTANSEMEFLTGHSMAFLPANTVAYNLYLNEKNAFSIVDLLNKEGYLTVGMHPEDPTNWSRDKIYPYYGFSKILFIDDFTAGLSQDDWYRDHVSDSAIFRKIMSLYEEKEEGTPLFTFAVTMMNHGGYSTENFDYTVHLSEYDKYTGTQEYLSSIQQTDKALQELIGYFENVDEETIIVFFGDHQPSLSDSFYSTFFGLSEDPEGIEKQAKYAVPYLIWANFDFEDDQDQITSLNYLSGKMLQIAGIEMTPYLRLISEIRKEYPALTAAGYFDRDYNYYPFSQYPYTEVGLLEIYEQLQYNALFDDKTKLYPWFQKESPAVDSTEPPATGKEEDSD